MQLVRKSPSWLGLSTALLLVLSQTSSADNGFNALSDMFTYNGFGTAGVARSDTNRAEFVEEGQNYGASENFDWKTDSKLGLQGTFAPTSWVSGTVQALAEERFSDHISTEIEWAFVKVAPLDGLSIRGGKLALPLFLVSDSRNVGYANNWVRAPDEVYGPAQFDTFSGFDAAYRHSIGNYSLTVGALAGKTTPTDYLAAPGIVAVIMAHDVRGYSASADFDVATVRLSRVTAVAEGVIHGFDATGRVPYAFNSLGATYDHDNVVGQYEFIEERRFINGVHTNYNGWYALGGYRIGKWLPYVIYADAERLASDGVTTPELSRHTESIGVRLDWFKSVDFKAQLDHVTGFGGGPGYTMPFVNVQPGFDNKANLVTLTADFVF